MNKKIADIQYYSLNLPCSIALEKGNLLKEQNALAGTMEMLYIYGIKYQENKMRMKIKKELKRPWIILSCIILLCVIVLEKRSFYCLENGNCITVWKNIGGTCYVMPYKYYGLLHPSTNYFKTDNLSSFEIFFLGNPDSPIIVRAAQQYAFEVVNKSTYHSLILGFLDSDAKYTTILFDGDGYLNDGITSICVDIAENRLIERRSKITNL